MIHKLQRVISLCVLLAIIFVSSKSETFASSPRKILVENYASSLLPSASASNAGFRSIYLNDKDIIPLYFSVNLNGGDEINNLEELTYQRYGQFYPQDEPMSNAKFCVNGEICYFPSLQATINKYKSKTAPFTLYVIETLTETNILGTVVIETDVDIPPSAQLFFAAVEKTVNISGVSETFYNVARLFRGSPLIGIDILMKAGERKGFNEIFPYNPKWKKNDMYLVAFIQDFAKNKEVLQVATTYDNSKEKPTIGSNLAEVNYTNENFTEIINVELINTSLANLDLESITFEGPGKDAFRVRWDLSQPKVFAANRRIVSFEFKPENEGVYEATLTVKSNATNRPTLTIPVKGELDGIVPLPEISYNFNTLNFGATTNFKELELNLVNTGNVNLTIDSIYVEAPDDKYFKVVNTIPKFIAPNRSEKLRVRFEPEKSESYFAQLIIKSNAVNEPEVFIGLSGEGQSVKPYSTLLVNTDTLNFGTVSSIIYSNITIKNDGNKDLMISNFSLQNNIDGVFKLEANPIKVIKPNEEINVAVSFDPTDNKPYEATILIQSDASNAPLQFIQLQGTGEGIVIGSINEDLSSKIKLYPNPVVNSIKLELPSEISLSEISDITIMNMNGKELQKLSLNQISMTGNEIEFNIDNNSTGVYILKINTSKDYYFAKFIIQ